MRDVLLMKNVVVKDNRLIQASYILGLVEQRLILLAIVSARELQEIITSETLLTIKAEDYAKHFNVGRQAAYMALADAVETLFNRRATVEVYDKHRDMMRPLVVRWVTAMQYEENLGSVTLRFGQEVIPLITQLENQFTRYELQQVADLKSAYAIRLYELLIQWRVAGKTPIFELQTFRRQLGIIDDEYKLMHQFKARVLDQSITQINTHTDITVTYQQHKSGRIITGFSFTFKVKNTQIEPKEVKKETINQTDSKIKATTNERINKIAQQFIALNSEQQTLILNHIKTQLSGLKKSKFNIEWDTFKAVGSKAIFQEFYESFAKALALLNIK